MIPKITETSEGLVTAMLELMCDMVSVYKFSVEQRSKITRSELVNLGCSIIELTYNSYDSG